LKILLALSPGRFKHWGMIAAAAQKTAFHFTLNWFDVALVLILAFGFWRGRKRGMSREFLPVSLWLTLVIACGFGYRWVGDQLAHYGVIRSAFGKTFNEHTASYLAGYLLIAFVVLLIFSFVNRAFKAKLEGSNAFGSTEYYYGIGAGMIRYASIVLVALALLNAPFYSAADIAAAKAFNNRWFGGGMKEFSGDFIPSVQEVQAGVFKESISGQIIKEYMGMVLIDTTSASPVKKPGQH
jgi:uncharacterized membrane protein required for colicin V production